jgi:RNA polymerase-associated protein RTF1
LKEEITLEQLQSIQVTRDELEKWCHATFFEDTVIGCFVRLGLGIDKNTKERVYRIAQITGNMSWINVIDVVEYHRMYKFGNTVVQKALELKHGKAQKSFLMDITSNSPFTEVKLIVKIIVSLNSSVIHKQ